MAITLVKDFSGSSTYIQDHEDNYTAIESSINTLEGAAAGQNSLIAVPEGLREIFDRDGVIGKDSYLITAGVKSGDNLGVPAGAAWISNTLRTKSSSDTISLSSFTATGTLYLNVASDGTANVTDTSGDDSVYSFTWTPSTSTVSSVTYLVDILFDGDDYNNSLGGFTSLDGRLDNIEAQLGMLGAFYQEDSSNHSGLNFAFKSGKVRNDNSVSDTASGTVTLTGSTTNYIEVNPSTGVVTSNTSGFTSNRIPLFQVSTGAGSIGAVTDKRTWAALGGGGGGGGHTQNTDTGTDNNEFSLLKGQSSGSQNALLSVDRGSDPNVSIRWNESTNVWEFTNDGTNYDPIGNLDLGVQELSKYVNIEDPPKVLEVLNASSTASYTQVVLTGASELVTALTDGISGMVLRIQVWDDAASSTTGITLRKIENPSVSPAVAYNVHAHTTGDPDEQQLHEVLIEGQGQDISANNVFGFEYLLTSSGSSTLHVRVYMTGFFAKVTGVGTQDRDYVAASNSVSAATTTQFDLTGFVNRGLVHKLKIEETSGNPTGGYDVKLYSKDTFASDLLLYQADSIDPASAYEDYVPFWVEDLDLSSELHLEIANTDGSNTGIYDVTIDLEQFA